MNNKIKIIVIVGPTGSGKSHFAIDLAKEFNGEIISADAFQVYQQLNIGTNKTKKDQQQNIKHYLIDNITINDEWNIKIFQKTARTLINNIVKNHKLPIICGGSGLYIDALIKNFTFPESNVKSQIDFSKFSNKNLYEKLLELDPYTANKIDKNNTRRMIRALTMIETTGIKKSDNDIGYDSYIYDPLIFFLNPQRLLIQQKIKERTKQMLDDGWRQEVKELIKIYPNFLLSNASKAIGYSYLANSSNNNESEDINKISSLINNYVKRQTTWFKNRYKSNIIIFNDFYNNEILFSAKTMVIKKNIGNHL